jgi:tetratricopeptide (TPR) repeat protein
MSPAFSRAVALLVCLSSVGPAAAGLYYSGEPMAELPSQWRGFLLDQRLLRTIAVKPTPGQPASPERLRYEESLKKLEKAAKERKLTAEEWADLGAILIRLGESARAVEVLRAAQRENPDQFKIVANLGTAYQLQGELDQAALSLQEAVRLSPGKHQEAEKAHLRLVRLRQGRPRDAQDLDDLFGIRYVGDSGKFEPGRLAEVERKKLPANGVAVAQQLALWLPADGRLLWQLAELAGAHGDVRTAAAIMDGCVTEFGMRAPELRQHRQANRVAAEELARRADGGTEGKTGHEGHAAVLKPRSSRPLASRFDASALPPIDPDGVNALPWAVVADTTVDRQFRPTFPKYLRELDGKRVSLSGFVQPLGDDLEMGAFMLIEYPVGCWYCEMPDVVGIVFVELPPEKTVTYSRNLVKVEGKLTLNSTDPENFLYTLSRAKVVTED